MADQTVSFPSSCPGCGSIRNSIQDGLAVFDCGTSIIVLLGRPRVRGKQTCIDRSRCSVKACPMPAARAGLCRAHLLETTEPSLFQRPDHTTPGSRRTVGVPYER